MSSPARPPATMVGDKFTKLYYSLMKDKPAKLHEVYKDSSMIGRPGKEGKMCHYTLSDIGENLNMLTSGGYDSVVVSSVVSQESINGSVAVNVDGYFVLNEKRLQRKFVQAFFLAPQEDGYFVMNDMFIFLNEKIPDVVGFTTILSKRPDCLKIRDTDSGLLPECTSIHLKNLPPNSTIDSIEDAFKEFGTVKRRGTEVWVSVNYKSTNKQFFEPFLVHGTVLLDRERSHKLQKEERRLGDFWEWQRSMAIQGKFREERGETGVDHSWDYDVVMKEHRKYMEEEQRKIQEEENQN